jgi:hypothetical protein
MPLPDDLHPYFRATMDRIVPDIANEVLPLVEGDAEFQSQLQSWLGCLRAESFAVFGQDFLDVHESTRDELLDRIDAENYRTDWKGLHAAAVLQRLVDLAAQCLELPKRQENPEQST